MTQAVPYEGPARVQANGIELAYDAFGDPTAPPLVLVAGLGAQMIAWDQEFCTELATRGLRVIRFDNRDAGLSTRFDQSGVPDLFDLMRLMVQRKAVAAPYSLDDMADDAAGLLDALGLESAHVTGLSMGGVIAQILAVRHPGRVRTLTTIMSTTGDPALPSPKPAALSVLLTPVPSEREKYIQSYVKSSRILAGPRYPLDEERARVRAAAFHSRGVYPEGTARQSLAVLAASHHKEALRSLPVPTLVIHGSADPLLPLACGRDIAETIPGARLMVIEGLGHGLPEAVWPQMMEAVVEHVHRQEGQVDGAASERG